MSRRPQGGPAAVFLNGKYEDAAFYRGVAAAAAFVVAADGGAGFLLANGIYPDLLVGDLDSIAPEDAARLVSAGVDTVRHATRKDETDGELAVDEALRRGAGEIVLAGALGALDHTLGHLAILRRLAGRSVPARLVAPGLTVWALVGPAQLSLDEAPGTRVSLAPMAGDAVVTLRGLDYPLERGLLPADACLGLGNLMTTRPASIAVHTGVVILMVEPVPHLGVPSRSAPGRLAPRG